MKFLNSISLFLLSSIFFSTFSMENQNLSVMDLLPNELLVQIIKEVVDHAYKTDTLQNIHNTTLTNRRFNTLLTGYINLSENDTKTLLDNSKKLKSQCNPQELLFDLVFNKKILNREARVIINSLLKAQVDLNYQDIPNIHSVTPSLEVRMLNYTPLFLALWNGATHVAEELLKSGAQLYGKKKLGLSIIFTPYKDKKPYRIILNISNTLRFKPNESLKEVILGNTLRDLIKSNLTRSFIEPINSMLLQNLIKAGAKLCLEDTCGKTALDYAKEHDLTHIIQMLEQAQEKRSNKSRNNNNNNNA